MNMKWRRHTLLIAAAAVLSAFVAAPGFSPAYDPGDIDHWLASRRELPGKGEPAPVTARDAVEAVKRYVERIRDGYEHIDDEGNWFEKRFLEDYRKVLDEWYSPEGLTVLPVHERKGGKTARYLVGMRKDGVVGGFWAVDVLEAEICGDLYWNERLEPLWRVDASVWDAASSAEEIPGLAELVPISDTFTMGIPVDPMQLEDAVVLDDALQMPAKTQEERKETIERLDERRRLGLQPAPVRELHSHMGRRTATSKCMSYAASYVADWWRKQCGLPLEPYVNVFNDAMEYGVNPRTIECLYYHFYRPSVFHLTDYAPRLTSKDRVTGEYIPFSIKRYARLLCRDDLPPEVEDPLFTGVRHAVPDMCMEGPPLRITLKFTNRNPEKAMKKFIYALEHYGILLGQHTRRRKDGTPSSIIGIHGIAIVGYGNYNGHDVVIYKETFGRFGPSYLEDSFGGPSYRIFPPEYFYQAFGFPHTIRARLEDKRWSDEGVGLTISFTTCNGRHPVDPDEITVESEGSRPLRFDAEPTQTAGRWKLFIPGDQLEDADAILVGARKRYFCDAEGRETFKTEIPLR